MRRYVISILTLLQLPMTITEVTGGVDNTSHIVFPTEDEMKTSSLLLDYTLYSTEHLAYTDALDGSREWPRDGHEYRDSVINYLTSPLSLSTSTDITAVLYGHNRAFGPLELIDIDLQDCVMRSQTHQVKGSEGSISMSLKPTSDTGEDLHFVNFCHLELTVPPGMVAYVEVFLHRSECDDCVRLILLDDVDSLLFDDRLQNLPKVFYTYSRSFKLLVKIIHLGSSFDLLMNFSASPETDRPYLMVNLTSSTTGDYFSHNF